MLGNRVRRHLLHCIFIGVGSAAVRFDRRYGLAAMFFGVYDGGRSFDGGHDGSEKQVDAGGGGNRVSDWQSRSQGASGGQGGVSGQKELENISKQVDGLKRQLQRLQSG